MGTRCGRNGGGRGEIKREGDRGVYSIAAIQSYSQGGSEKIDERVGKLWKGERAGGGVHILFMLEVILTLLWSIHSLTLLASNGNSAACMPSKNALVLVHDVHNRCVLLFVGLAFHWFQSIHIETKPRVTCLQDKWTRTREHSNRSMRVNT